LVNLLGLTSTEFSGNFKISQKGVVVEISMEFLPELLGQEEPRTPLL
jgi:hypothetical protein